MANRISKKSFLFMHGDIASPAIGELEQGSIPQERLAGFYQLKKLGWNVRISDSRWTAKTARIRRKFGRFVHLPREALINSKKGYNTGHQLKLHGERPDPPANTHR